MPVRSDLVPSVEEFLLESRGMMVFSLLMNCLVAEAGTRDTLCSFSIQHVMVGSSSSAHSLDGTSCFDWRALRRPRRS